jgi:hypothetical protein
MAISDLLVFLFVGAIAAYFSVTSKSNASRNARLNPSANPNLKPSSPLAIWLALMLLPTLLVGWSVLVRQPFPPILLVVVTLTCIWLYFHLSQGKRSPLSSLYTPSTDAIAELSPALSYVTKPVLEPEEEAKLKGCFPWAVFYVKKIEFAQQAIICRGQLRYQPGTNWQRSQQRRNPDFNQNQQQASSQEINQERQTSIDLDNLDKLSPSEAVYRIIAANIEAEFGDRFWLFFQPEPPSSLHPVSDTEDLETEPTYSFVLLPRLPSIPSALSNLDHMQIANLIPIGNNQARVELEAAPNVSNPVAVADAVADASRVAPGNRPTLTSLILPLVLLLITIATILAIGANSNSLNLLNLLDSQNFGDVRDLPNLPNLPSLAWGQGISYGIGILAILLAREISRRLVAKHYGITLTAPLAIPFLSGFGTLGVYSLPKSGYIPQRRAAFHLAIVPAVAGLAIALPLLVIGLINSSPTEIVAATTSY